MRRENYSARQNRSRARGKVYLRSVLVEEERFPMFPRLFDIKKKSLKTKLEITIFRLAWLTNIKFSPFFSVSYQDTNQPSTNFTETFDMALLVKPTIRAMIL